MKMTLIYMLSFMFLVGCAQAKKTVYVEQYSTDRPVVIQSNNTHTGFEILIPFAFEYKNESRVKMRVNMVDYYYNSFEKDEYVTQGRTLSGWLSNVRLYESKDGTLKAIAVGGDAKEVEAEFIRQGQRKELIAYTIHLLDTTAFFRNEIAPYVEKMKSLGVNEIELGSLQEFKKMHPRLTDVLLEGDSISFRISEKPLEYVTSITMPVEY